MRICFCNILYSKKNDRGGLGAHIQDLSNELAKRGHEVTILTSGKKGEYFEGSVRIVQLGVVSRFSGTWQLLNPLYWFHRFAYMSKLAKYVRKNQFDIVEAAEGGAEQLLLILQHHCPVITKLHGNFRHIYNRRILASIVAFFERFAVSRSDGVYTSSLAYAKTISSEFKIPLEKVRIIPYGIRIEDLWKIEQTGPNRKTVLLSVGSSPIRKGAMLFLEAAALLEAHNIQFLLSCSDEAFQTAIQVPKNVSMVGNLDRLQFYSLLSQADIVVFPSKFESFGIAAYEAMLLGKIVVISKNVPLEGSALLYNRCVVLQHLTGHALADAIRDIFSEKIRFPAVDSAILQSMRREYDIGNIAESTLLYYKEVLDQASTARALSPRTRGPSGITADR